MDSDEQQLDDTLRALADPTRRALLATIRQRPGLTTTELAQLTKGMSRWGVMKHLRVLEETGLIQTMPQGRHRRHFHEPVALDPLRRWLAQGA